MNADAPALLARARGLRGRISPLAEIAALAAIESPAALLATLSERGRLAAPTPGGAPGGDLAEAVELGFRRRAAELLTTLQRWRGRGLDALAVLFAEEDRRSLRALLRGAAAGAAPELRLAGLIPTPELPPRRLEDLARAADPAAVTARLAAFGWEEAAPLSAAAAATRPDLAGFEEILRARFGRRLRELARAGDRELRREVELAIDLDNVAAAAAVAGAGEPPSASDFLTGGRELSLELFERAARSSSAGVALQLLSSAFADAALRRALSTSSTSPARLGERLVAAGLGRATAAAREFPLGVAPLVELVLALRAEGMAIARLAWGLALEAPLGERRGAAA